MQFRITYYDGKLLLKPKKYEFLCLSLDEVAVTRM